MRENWNQSFRICLAKRLRSSRFVSLRLVLGDEHSVGGDMW